MDTSDISSKIQIVLITYNRSKYLDSTLSFLCNKNSPVRYFDITILDNKSEDNTFEIVKKYQDDLQNIKYISNNINIGGNANICKAFSMASKEYIWVLCDDDEYDFSHWNEVVDAVNQKQDLIVVSNYINPKYSIVNLVKQLTFVPAGIYRTEHFSSGMMMNAYYNIHTMFPQIAIASVYINQYKRIYICDNYVVKMHPNNEDASYIRGSKSVKQHPYMRDIYWEFGFITAIQLFENPYLRELLVDNINLEKPDNSNGYERLLRINHDLCNDNIHNISEIFCGMNTRQRIELFKNILTFYHLKDLLPYKEIIFLIAEKFNISINKQKIKAISMFKLIKYRLFSHILFGKLKKRYKHKYSELKKLHNIK